MIERELGHPRTPLTFPVSSVLHENDGGGMKGQSGAVPPRRGFRRRGFPVFSTRKFKPQARSPNPAMFAAMFSVFRLRVRFLASPSSAEGVARPIFHVF